MTFSCLFLKHDGCKYWHLKWSGTCKIATNLPLILNVDPYCNVVAFLRQGTISQRIIRPSALCTSHLKHQSTFCALDICKHSWRIISQQRVFVHGGIDVTTNVFQFYPPSDVAHLPDIEGHQLHLVHADQDTIVLGAAPEPYPHRRPAAHDATIRTVVIVVIIIIALAFGK